MLYVRISIAEGKYHAVRHITCAFGANIDLHVYNFPGPLSLALYVRISIAVYGKYRAAMRHITCAFGANIDLLEYPLIHRRRDGGPPSPQRLLCNRGKVGVEAEPTNDGQPFPQSLLIFGLRGRLVYGWIANERRSIFSTKLGKAERTKVGVLYI